MVGVRGGLGDANCPRQMTLGADTVALLRRKSTRVHDCQPACYMARFHSRDVLIAGAMTTLATHTVLTKRRLRIAVLRSGLRFHPARVAVQTCKIDATDQVHFL